MPADTLRGPQHRTPHPPCRITAPHNCLVWHPHQRRITRPRVRAPQKEQNDA